MDQMDICQIETLLKKNHYDRGLERIVSAKWEPAVNKGDNYASQMWRVRIQGVLGSGETTDTTVIVKAVIEEPITREFIEDSGIMDDEFYVYNEILREMEKLIQETPDPRGKFWCDLLGYEPGRYLIFSDLKRCGYGLCEKTYGMDLEHALITVKTIARFHAMSRILLKSRKISVSKLKPCIYAQNLKILNNYYKGAFNSLFLAMKTWGGKWVLAADRLERTVTNFSIKFQELGKLDECNFNVLNHGDAWINNLMFRNHPDSNHIDCMMVDFQIPHYNSFAWDLTYFLYSSLLPDVRKKNYNLFLNTYRKELSLTFELMKFDPLDVPTLEQMDVEMTRLNFYGLMLVCLHLPATIAKPELATEIQSLLTTDNSSPSNKIAAMFNNEIFTSQFKQDLEDYFFKQDIC